jgi:hypothetical protein
MLKVWPRLLALSWQVELFRIFFVTHTPVSGTDLWDWPNASFPASTWTTVAW